MRRGATVVAMLVLGWVLAPATAWAPPSPPPPDEYIDVESGVVNVHIPDDSGTPGSVSDTIDVGAKVASPDAELVDLNVSVEIIHGFVGDLKLILTNVGTGQSVVLMDQPGVPATEFGCDQADVEATFDDASGTSVETMCLTIEPAAIAGTVMPTQALSSFDYSTIGTEWKLTVEDHTPGVDGYLWSWTLHFGVMTCGGEAATIVGSLGDDTIDGTGGDDVIHASDGHDEVNGKGGDDVICLGDDDDIGNGGSGNDVIFGGKGADTIDGGSGKDKIKGGGGGDTITGGKKRDKLFGQGGKDDLFGNGGNDLLEGGGKDDALSGGAGDDELIGGGGTDSADGGGGTDTCDAETEVACEI